eukprot:g3619.t1
MGASAGKKALHRTLDALVGGQSAGKDDVGIIFDSYVGKPKNKSDTVGPAMTLAQITAVFKDIVEYQRKTGLNIFTAASKAYYVSDDYKRMSFMERAGVSTMIFTAKATVITIFDSAMSTYASEKNMQSMLKKFSPDGIVRRDIFVKKAPVIIGAELASANLVVSNNVLHQMAH